MASDMPADETVHKEMEKPAKFRAIVLVRGHATDRDILAIQAAVPDSGILIENPSCADLLFREGVFRVFDYFPEVGDLSAREEARRRLAQLSTRVLRSTGKPVWQSFEYKGISAWWFLEIVLHEPAFLEMRRAMALEKAKKRHGAIETIIWEHGKFEWCAKVRTLPVVPEPSLAVNQKGPFRGKVSVFRRLRALSRVARQYSDRVVRFAVQQFGIFSLARRETFAVFEHENLRRHIDLGTGQVQAILPYAEGVIENLWRNSGGNLLVLSRSRLCTAYEGWDFVSGSLPTRVARRLPETLARPLDEVSELLKPIIGNYLAREQFREILAFRLTEYDLYERILRRIRPRSVFVYNWEGVFRPLTIAARALNIRVIGVQQALGPYLHALNHIETGYYGADNPLGFAIPDALAVWGDFHHKEISGFGFPELAVVTTGYARLDKHSCVAKNEMTRTTACKNLNLDPNRRYLMFTGQARILDTAILTDEHFAKSLEVLARLATEFGLTIIVKPWSSDYLDVILRIAASHPDLIWFAPQTTLVGNADLLSVSEWCVGTFSSIMGEAIAVGNACLLLNYPESRYYFDLPYVEKYRPLMEFADNPAELDVKLRALLENDALRDSSVARGRSAMIELFGPLDGKSAERISSLVLKPHELTLRMGQR